MKSRLTGIRSGALICLGFFVFIICSEAFAPRQRWVSRWRQRYEERGRDSSQTQYNTGGSYVYNPRTRSHQYRAPEPYNSDSQHSMDVRSEVTHWNDGSTGQHGYDVNRTYRTTQGGRTLAEGRIGYQGRSTSNYQHDGSSGSIGSVDRVERAAAGENRDIAQFLSTVAGGMAVSEQNFAIYTDQYRKGAVPRREYELISAFFYSNKRMLSAAASGRQVRDLSVKQQYSVQVVNEIRQMIGIFNTLDREIGIQEPIYSQCLSNIYKLKQAVRDAGYRI